MDRENFIQSSVRIRHAEKKLLTKQQLQRLADAKNLEDAIKLLNETSYSSELSKLDRPENYEQVLSEVLNKTYKEAMEISPEKSLVEILSCKYDYHNLKVLVKENILKEKFDSMYCMLDGNEIEAFRELALKNDEGLSKDFKECLDFFETTKDPQDIDIFIDKKYFEKVLSLAEEFKLEMITEYFKAMIDFINLRTFIRCRKQNQVKETLEKVLIKGGDVETDKILDMFYEDIEILPIKLKAYKIGRVLSKIVEEYKNTNSLNSFEKSMDDYLVEIVRKAKSIHYGAEVIFSFLFAKEMEIKNLRLILVGKVNGLSADFIKERLREVYV
ncbi:V-type ATP synthase subunit C [Parvimonas micra]|uniref:V-type ATP synthase subunit C n=1 Tax=Parvimonas micra TaxID=33033 RepID=UPI001E2BDA5A|nr:V-type ATP synthase subunit C [Parvimonas micra]MCE3020279.1 V-type ATP synthase subunit C [Parvimonas micra]